LTGFSNFKISYFFEKIPGFVRVFFPNLSYFKNHSLKTFRKPHPHKTSPKPINIKKYINSFNSKKTPNKNADHVSPAKISKKINKKRKKIPDFKKIENRNSLQINFK
jgi:hypothetical protein